MVACLAIFAESADGSPRRRRSVEVKHGCICVLATLGYITFNVQLTCKASEVLVTECNRGLTLCLSSP